MTRRAERKIETRGKIVDAATRRFRKEGLEGATIAKVLGDAGLTHGTFYAHFQSKEALLAEAFVVAAADTSERWIKGVSGLSTEQGLGLLLARGLGTAHLNHPESGCPFVAAGAEVWRGTAELRQAYQEGMLAVARKVADSLGNEDDIDQALAIHAICIGGLTMARSVASEKVALRVMRACRRFVLKRVQPGSNATGSRRQVPGRMVRRLNDER
jgi:TetR/AcrR family transcriptional repressor of nem operon